VGGAVLLIVAVLAGWRVVQARRKRGSLLIVGNVLDAAAAMQTAAADSEGVRSSEHDTSAAEGPRARASVDDEDEGGGYDEATGTSDKARAAAAAAAAVAAAAVS
jgi:hypothetical protein